MLQARSVYIGNQSLLLQGAGSFKKCFQRFIAGILAVTFFGIGATLRSAKHTSYSFIERDIYGLDHLSWLPDHAAVISWWSLRVFVSWHGFLYLSLIY